jgi:hypothetical protein
MLNEALRECGVRYGGNGVDEGGWVERKGRGGGAVGVGVRGDEGKS